VGVVEKEEEPKTKLGTEENPIIWSFVPYGEIERVVSSAQLVADLLYDKTGLYISTSVTTEYTDVVEAMANDPPEVHMASLDTFAYILAADRGAAEAMLVSVRYGSPTYNGQFIARADSGISEVADLMEIIDAGSHVAVFAAVYNKDVYAGATHVDARSSLEKDYSDIMDKVVAIKVMADIPNDELQFIPSLPKEMRVFQPTYTYRAPIL